MKTPIIAESGIEIKKNKKSHPELHRVRFWEVFWLTLAPLWVHFGRLWPKMALQGPMFTSPENPKSVQKRTFENRRALGPSKNCLREGVRKKHEHLKKNVNIEGFRRLHGVGLTVFEKIL